jgi:hypothetical protein
LNSKAISIDRRNALGRMLAAGTGLLAGSGRSGSGFQSGGAAPPFAMASEWDVQPWMWVVAGNGMSVDLSVTLPAGGARGGIFDVDPGGTQLPAGMTLMRAGTLRSPTQPSALRVV